MKPYLIFEISERGLSLCTYVFMSAQGVLIWHLNSQLLVFQNIPVLLFTKQYF